MDGITMVRDPGEYFERFYSVQCKKYFDGKGKEAFDTAEEKDTVSRVIQEGWNVYIESKKEKLTSMRDRDIVNLFEAIDLEFPEYKYYPGNEDDIDADEDEVKGLFLDDDDDDDFEFDDELEILEEELNRLSEELNDIPAGEREDVMMLMLAFPALQEIEFPVDVFLSGDGSTHLTNLQRQQIDWARQLAYKIVEMIEEDDAGEKKKKYTEVSRFAAAFIPPNRIDDVITEIQITYERARGSE